GARLTRTIRRALGSPPFPPSLLMSSQSDKTPRGRVARRSPGAHTGLQRGRSSALSVVDPGQLTGPRAGTRIRSGGATRRSRAMDQVSVGIDVSKAMFVV